MVQGEAVQYHRSALGNVHAVVDKIFSGTVWRSVPEGSVNTEDLLDNRTDVRQALLVFGFRPAIPTDNEVEFMVSTRLNIGVLANESEEPLNDARGLSIMHCCVNQTARTKSARKTIRTE